MTEIKKVKQTLGFVSMTITWLITNFLFIIYQIVVYSEATDVWPMVFWTAIFMFLAWIIFIILPLHFLNHSRPIFKPTIFPFVTGLYGALTFAILIGGIFMDRRLVTTFLPLAFIAGLIFGFSYSILMRADKLVKLLVNKPIFKIILFLVPFMIFAALLALNRN